MATEIQSHESGSFFQVHEAVPDIAPYSIVDIGAFTVSNTTTTVLLIGLIVAILVMFVSRARLIPSRFQHITEMFYEQVLTFVTSIVGDVKRGKMVVPFVGALMVYLLIANLLPMMPGVSGFFFTSADGEHIPLFRGATTDFNTTFGLALAVVISMQIIGMKEQGVFGYLSHFIQIKQVWQGFRRGLGHGLVACIGFLVGLIEILSEFAKMLSLSLRLFGNLFAHEVLTVILLGAFAYGVPALWMGMGVIVGIVQSVVFVALVTVYYSLVLRKEHDKH